MSSSFGSKRVRRTSSSWSSGKRRGPLGLNSGSSPGRGMLMSLGCRSLAWPSRRRVPPRHHS
eukprot:2940028-Alexandrium_andersonii.AAC.1